MIAFRTLLAASAAMSLVATPVAAQAQAAPAFLSSNLVTKSFRATNSLFCPQNSGDCVLPLPDAAPAPAPAPRAPPVTRAPTPVPAVEPVVEGGGFPILGALLAAAAIGAGIYFLTDSDEDDLPTSP